MPHKMTTVPCIVMGCLLVGRRTLSRMDCEEAEEPNASYIESKRKNRKKNQQLRLASSIKRLTAKQL